jgi:hypothetical protein
MFPSVANGDVSTRSIATDDSNGVKAVYGPKDAAKPRITSVSLAGTQVTINGTNFSPTNNQVWFTKLTAAGFGPVVVTNVSSNGTQIVVNAPINAGPGDVMVRKNAAGFSSLSNAWPIDPSSSGCLAPTTYCQATINSTGFASAINWAGSASVAANNLVLQAFFCPPSTNGIFFYGPQQTQAPLGNGNICITGGTFRLPAVATDAGGTASHALDITSPPPGGQITAGSIWHFQFWFRDIPAGGSQFNFSNGLKVTFCP